MRLVYVFILLLILLVSCQSDPNYEYIDLEDYKYEDAGLKNRTEILLLSFSDGKPCGSGTVYYYQFIGINKETGDTVRIFSPCQVYDYKKQLREATFVALDNDVYSVRESLDADSKDEVLVFNKRFADLEKGNYKTAFGSLAFNVEKADTDSTGEQDGSAE